MKENAGPWTNIILFSYRILKPKGYVLYYQQPNSLVSENQPDHYYQLTLSNNLWLKNGRRFGNFCIGIDGKYDLNNDHAPVLTVVVKNNARCTTPLVYYIVSF